jgi:hypothetical protein
LEQPRLTNEIVGVFLGIGVSGGPSMEESLPHKPHSRISVAGAIRGSISMSCHATILIDHAGLG